jgi:dCMP deaminase
MSSDDPNTKNGAVIISADARIIGTGVNRFPRGVKVTEERLQRPLKYEFMEHAERNAVFDACRRCENTIGSTMYCPWYACVPCARAIIEAGIICVIGHKQIFDRTPEHWLETIAIGNEMFREAGVEIIQFDGFIGNCTSFFNSERWNP